MLLGRSTLYTTTATTLKVIFGLNFPPVGPPNVGGGVELPKQCCCQHVECRV